MRKKTISIVLAAMLVFSMISMSAYAATENQVTKVPNIAVDESIPHGDVYLVINDANGHMGDDEQSIRLMLENATWAPADQWMVQQFHYYKDGNPAAVGKEASVSFSRTTDKRLDLTFSLDSDDVGEEVDEIRIPLMVTVEALGEAAVTIDPLNSSVSAGEHIFAQVVEGKTNVTVEEVITFGPREEAPLSGLIIDETAAESLDTSENMIFRLPSGFRFVEDAEFTVRGIGIFDGSATLNQQDFWVNDREIAFSLDDVGIDRYRTDQRGTIKVSDLTITSRGDQYGSVNLTVSGALSEETIEVAEYIEYGVKIEADGPLASVFAGRFNETEGEGFELATLIIEEQVLASIASGRLMDITFPDWIKVTYVSGVDPIGYEAGDNVVTFRPERESSGQRMAFEINFEVTAHPHASGDITAQITGGGLDNDFEVVLGEAVKPVEIEGEAVKLVVNDDENVSPELTITEASTRALMEGTLEVTLGLGEWTEVPEVEVTAGDLSIGEIEIDEGVLTIEITGESAEASELKIHSVELEVSGLPALGFYGIDFGGTALINNNVENFFDEDRFETLELMELVESRTTRVTFTVGQSFYWVGDEMIEMDTAPYIAANRLMVPVAHVSRGLGIDRDDVVWDGEARTVTILAPTGETLQMTIGSQILIVGDEEVDMGAMAEITDDRTFVPISRFARALDIDYTWNPATETVEFQL